MSEDIKKFDIDGIKYLVRKPNMLELQEAHKVYAQEFATALVDPKSFLRDKLTDILIEKGLYCYVNLDYFDTIGCNILNECLNDEAKVNSNHSHHYSGNFWWSKSSYIRSLNYLETSNLLNENLDIKRYQCENWILSNKKNRNIGIIYQDNTNIHPYHRYIFDNYKNKKLLIKKLITKE